MRGEKCFAALSLPTFLGSVASKFGILRRAIKILISKQRCNIFRFGSAFYAQKKGTCMGTPMAPNYANLFMDRFEETLLDEFYKKNGVTNLSAVEGWLCFRMNHLEMQTFCVKTT